MLKGYAQGAAIKRESIQLRVSKAKEIIAADAPEKHWLIWHDLEAERDLIERTMPGGTTVYGSQDLDERETPL
jgi:hypothetical protein